MQTNTVTNNFIAPWCSCLVTLAVALSSLSVASAAEETPDALVDVARDFYRQKKYAEGEAAATRAIQIDPKHAVAHRVRGMLRTFLERYDEAIVDLDFAIASNPRDADARKLRGNLRLATKKYDLAIAEYTEAIRLIPQYSAAYLGRGRTYEAVGEKEKAAADFALAEKYKDFFKNRRAKTATANP